MESDKLHIKDKNHRRFIPGRWGKRIRYVIGGLVFYLMTAVLLVLWPDPQLPPPLSVDSAVTNTMLPSAVAERPFEMRDGETLSVLHWPAPEAKTVLLFVHGIMTDGDYFQPTATWFHERGTAVVYTFDLRGHGRSGGVPGDIDRVGRYEEDLADMIAAVRGRHPHQRLILAGHSMGGGIVLRHAMTFSTVDIDGYLLFSPYLGPFSPTMRPELNDDGRAVANDQVQIHWSRTAGLLMLNAVGIRAMNDRSLLFFRKPTDPNVTRTYTLRALMGAGPLNHRSALAAIERPTLVLVGSEEELFDGDAFEPTLAAYAPDVHVERVSAATHDSLRKDETALQTAAEWLDNLP